MKALNELVVILEQHAANATALLSLAEEKRERIMANDTGRIDSITGEEAELIGNTRALEEKREACVQTLVTQLNLPAEAKLDSVLAAVDADEQGRIAPIRTDLRKTLESLRERNERNMDLLLASVDHIHGLFLAIGETRADSTAYTSAGKPSARQRPFTNCVA